MLLRAHVLLRLMDCRELNSVPRGEILMTDQPVSDLSDYDEEHNDQTKIIDDDAWVPCRICKEIFLRVRLTARYCNSCKRAFCEGEHGNFAGAKGGVCVRCFNKARMELAPTASK